MSNIEHGMTNDEGKRTEEYRLTK